MKIPSKFRLLFQYLNPNHKGLPSQIDTVVITGGRGSGKSYPVAYLISLMVAIFSGIKVLFTRYTMTSAGSSIIPEFQEKINLSGLQDVMRPVTRDGKKMVESDNGSEILFRGIKTSSGNQTAALKSLKDIAIWVLDEAEELVYESEYDKIDLSVRSNKFRNLSILILNPTHKKHWIYRRFFKEAGVKAGYNGVVGNVLYIHTTFLDNILNLPVKILNAYRRLKKKDPKKFLHVVMGGWLDQKEGLVYNFKLITKRPDNLRLIGYGMDFGFANDPTAFVAVYEMQNTTNGIYLETIFAETGLYNADIARRIEEYKDFNHSMYIVCDSNAPEKISELYTKYGLQCVKASKGNGSVLSGIDKIRGFDVHVLSGNPMAEEATEYSYHEDMKIEGKYENNPEKGNDHSLDAARYCISKLIRN